MTIDLKDALNKCKSPEQRIKYLHMLTLTKLRVITANPSAEFRSSNNGLMIINKIIPRHILPDLSQSVNSQNLLTLKRQEIVENCLSVPVGNPENDRFFNRNDGSIEGYIYLCVCIISLLNTNKSNDIRLEEVITCITVLIKMHYNDTIFSTEEKIAQFLLFLLEINPPLKFNKYMSNKIFNDVIISMRSFLKANNNLPSTGFNNDMISLLTKKERAVMNMFSDIGATPASNINSELENLYSDLITAITDSTQDPFDVAANFFIRFNKIHAFADGNGRLSRSLADDILCTLLPKDNAIRQANGIFSSFIHDKSSSENTQYAFVTDAMNVELLANYLRTNKFLNCELFRPIVFTPNDTDDGYGLQNARNYLLKQGLHIDVKIVDSYSSTLSILSSKIYDFLPVFSRQRAFTALASAVVLIGAGMYADRSNENRPSF